MSSLRSVISLRFDELAALGYLGYLTSFDELAALGYLGYLTSFDELAALGSLQ